MWLIEKEEKRFIADENDVCDAAKRLREAQDQRKLTLVVGNGPSQSAAWLHGKRKKWSDGGKDSIIDLSWSGVVKRAAAEAGVKPDLVDRNQNNLALAQAVLVRYEASGIDVGGARLKLVSSLKDAFKQNITPTRIDEMLAKLEPGDVVTTNYDFQLERAFERFSPSRWMAFVPHGQARQVNDGMTWIHKMHGSFKPDADVLANYQFSEVFPPDRPEQSIVITESDYDECYMEIGRANLESSSLMLALSKTCLILGKGLDTQDISFMYALRKTRAVRRRAGHETFMLFNGPLTAADELNLNNLEIKPLVINLPRAAENGHYYFGLIAALARLFPDLNQIFEDAKADSDADFPALVSGPDVVAVGLASRNITGHTKYQDKNQIPPPGRRNLRYSDIEEHVGGSALTPLMILSALNIAQRYRLSMVSAIGGENDTYGKEILRASRAIGVNTDAVSCNQTSSWHSTVLVHTSKTHEEKDYPGQRIFLDRGYDRPVGLDGPEREQLHAQLRQKNLRLVYLDKFLATQHPPPKHERELEPDKLGPLLRQENLDVLSQVIAERPEVDVVYETGGGGSPFQHVEKGLSQYINVFTTGFPFFASVVLYRLGLDLPSSLEVFNPEMKWWEADFARETKAIEETLYWLVGLSIVNRGAQRVFKFSVPDVLLTEVCMWAGRTPLIETFKRRWFITTLHHIGALGIDLVNNVGWYCCTPTVRGSQIQNTSGAGDSFRGALMYALLSATINGPEALPRALVFATDVATERCRHFRTDKACEKIREGFGGQYAEYEKFPISVDI